MRKKVYVVVETWGKYYKTFYGRKLQIFIVGFVPGKPFQPSLMFAGKTRAYLSEA